MKANTVGWSDIDVQAMARAKAFRHCARNDGRVFNPMFSIGPYGYIVLVTDTEGSMIGLHSPA